MAHFLLVTLVELQPSILALMITDFETYKDVYDYLAKDHEKINYRVNYYLPKAIKELQKATTFPACKWYGYECPKSKNKFIIFFYAENQNQVSNPHPGCFLDVKFENKPYFIKWWWGGYKHSDERNIEGVRQIFLYTKHFMKRYNQRFLKNDTFDFYDVACRFFARNYEFMPIEVTEGINEKVEKYGDIGKRAFRAKDGMCFAKSWLEGLFYEDGDKSKDIIDAIVFEFSTFVPEFQMTEKQRLAIEKEHWEKWTQSFDDFMKEAKDGELMLRLNH